MSKKGAVVVARFDEPLDWTLAVRDLDIVVYDKGVPAAEVPPHVRVIPCPNVGREAYAYLRYIVDFYEELPDYVVFAQAAYDEHLTEGAFRALLRGVTLPPTEPDLDAPWDSTLMRAYGWTPDANYTAGRRMQPADATLGEFYRRHVGPTLPDKCPWWKNAIFCVSRDRILRHPKSRYETMSETLQHVNPETAHYMERFWHALFCGS